MDQAINILTIYKGNVHLFHQEQKRMVFYTKNQNILIVGKKEVVKLKALEIKGF